MKKIWVIRGNIFKSENKFLKSITHFGDNVEYSILTVSESGTISDLKSQLLAEEKSNERQLQIKSVLGELSIADKNLLNKRDAITHFMDIYSKTERPTYLSNLEKLSSKPSEFSNFLVKYKKYFLTQGDNVEWYKALLGCHNFMNCFDMKYSYREKCKTDKVGCSDKKKEAFKLAKEEIKNKK